MKDETVRQYYEKWTLLPALLGKEKEYFYQFVQACLRLDRRLDIDYLKGALYDSFHEQYDEKTYDEFCYEVIALFEHLRDFSNTNLP